MRSDSYKERRVRLTGADDRPQLEDLWKRCFGDTESFTKYYFDWYFLHNRVLVCEEDGRILGQLHENEYDFSLYGQQVRLPYIVGVSTDAAVRGQGIMRSLLNRSLRDAADRELPFVYLMPADEAIYKPFGFAYMYAQDIWKRKAIRLGDPRAEALRTGRASYAGITARKPSFDTAFAAAAAIGSGILEDCCDIFTQRDVWYLKRLAAENQADGGDFMLLYAEDGPAGYVSFSIEDEAEVRELAFLPEYEKCVCSWFLEAFADKDVLLLPMPGTSAFSDVQKHPVIMGRIAHLPAFLSMLKPEEDVSLVIELTDDIIAENSGCWRWTCKDGVCRAERAGENEKPDLCLGAADLLQMAMGYKEPAAPFPQIKCRIMINEIV